MLVQIIKRDRTPDEVYIFEACVIGSHYVQFLTLL
jgi:hypothetical protein